MPRKDGIEMLTDLRKNAWGAHVPVIMLTNLNDPDHINKAKALGAKDFIIKADWKLSEVIEKVRKYVDEEKT
jgi:response regulator RpfG family c-di-GMP phosphodiesterase